MIDEAMGLEAPRLIINLLTEKKGLTAKAISEEVSRILEKDIEMEYIEGLLERMSDSTKSTIGYFLKKKKVGKGVSYSFVEEALEVPKEKIYALYLPADEGGYDLEQLLEEYPELARHVISTSNLNYDIDQETEFDAYELDGDDSAGSDTGEDGSVNVLKADNVYAASKMSDGSKALIRRFSMRPGKYADRKFAIQVVFLENPEPADDSEVRSLNLKWGDTLRILGRIPGTEGLNYFYGTGKIADWMENIEPDQLYSVQVKTMFGVDKSVHQVGSTPVTYEESQSGFLIVSVK